MARVLPRPREAAVVEEDVALLELAQDALLLVLLDGRRPFGSSDLKFLSSAFGDLADKVEQLAALLAALGDERDVVPQT